MKPTVFPSLAPKQYSLGSLSRRRFLAGCASCAAYVCLGRLEAATPCAISSADLLPKDKARVRLVFSHIPPTQATWPNIGYDYESRKKELTAKLTAACPGVEFVPATAQNADQARKMVAENPDIDGYVVYTVGIWTGVANEIAASGKPTLMVDDLYGGSGEFLIAYAAAQRKGLKVAGVSSSKIEDAAQAVREIGRASCRERV